MPRHAWVLLPAMFCALTPASSPCAAGQADYFLLVVWDGMRPDFVSAELTPNLHRLRQNGVWFANHRSAFPTSTEVNGAVLATGVFPRRSGVTANNEYRREIDPLNRFNTAALSAVRRGDALTGGKFLLVPTIAELVQGAGGRTAVAGAKPVALLHDRLTRSANSANPVWFVNGSLPEKLSGWLTNRFGAFPAAASPNVARDKWTTRCLTEAFWEKEMPRYSVLWLSEPDYSQHQHGPGSSEALAAIRSSDERLAAVLAELDRRGLREKTDIFVVSDHGFSTISQTRDVAATLRAAGINAKTLWQQPPEQDDVIVVGNGGSMLIYVTGRSPVLLERIVAALQQGESTGVIFTRNGLPGTFALSEASLDSVTAPDIIVVSAWKMANESDAQRRVDITNDVDSEYKPGGGMHVTLSPTDLHNMAIAAGPDFRRGASSTIPSGNVDIAPTLLWLMGIKPPEPLDGRVLNEALVAADSPIPAVQPGRLDARNASKHGTWEQYLKFSEVNGVRYLDEGNGKWKPVISPKPTTREAGITPNIPAHTN